MQDSETIANIGTIAPAHPVVNVEGWEPHPPDFFCLREVTDIFGASFFDHNVCRQWILNRLHPSGAHCPMCAAAVPEKFHKRFWSGERMRCQCGKFFTALTGTFLSGCSLDFREVILLAVLLCLGIDNRKIAGFLKMTPESIRIWRQKFSAFETIERMNSEG